MTKEERDGIDQAVLEETKKHLNFALPYTEDDLEQVYYLGQVVAINKLKAMMIGMVVNGTCNSVITEEILDKLLKEVNGEESTEG